MPSGRFCCYSGPHSKNEREQKKIVKYLDLAREYRKVKELEGDGDTNSFWCTWDGLLTFERGSRKIGNQRKKVDHPKYCMGEIGQNTVKSPANLRRLAVP